MVDLKKKLAKKDPSLILVSELCRRYYKILSIFLELYSGSRPALGITE